MDELTLKINQDLELRLSKPEDADVVFALVNKNRAYLREWLPWVEGTQTVEDSKKFLEESVNLFQKKDTIQLGIWWKDKLVGAIGLHEINNPHKKATIGYWLDVDAQGGGIMSQAVKALVDYAFNELNLNKVTIHAAAGNSKSRAIPERLGFKHEGTLRDNEWLYDHFVDSESYSILKKDWNNN